MNNGAMPHDPKFFARQSEELTKLLYVIVDESKTATTPDALVDYLELTEILTTLLDEARLYSVLGADDLQLRNHDVSRYTERISALQHVIGDWGVRTKLHEPRSRKRARSVDVTEEATDACKRLRGTEFELDMVEDGSIINLGHAIVELGPPIEEVSDPWWTQPFCD